MKDKWKKRFELAYIRCREVVDLDSDPVIKYTAVKCSTALQELRDLDKLHYEEMNDLLTQLITEVQNMEKKNRAEIGIQFFSGYNEAVSDFITLLKNKRDNT